MIAGAILGTAVGDAIGLPYEGLSRRRLGRLTGAALGHRFLLNRGMVSDDTEHTCLVGQALIASSGDPQRFGRSLAWRLRRWFWSLPPGIGLGTARAMFKLSIGLGHARSGVYSAGNGPAMRAALLGACYHDEFERAAPLLRISTRITHTDPRAEHGALVIAYAAKLAADGVLSADPGGALDQLQAVAQGEQLDRALCVVKQAFAAGDSPQACADALDLESGVTGYINHTVPAAVMCAISAPDDYRQAIEHAVRLGGDTDTVGAIVGGIVGASVGASNISADWLDRLIEWPRSRAWMTELAGRLAASRRGDARVRPPRLIPLVSVVRNLMFLTVVLGHGLRRCLPPY